MVYLTLREPPRIASPQSRARATADFVALPGVVRHLLALPSYRWILLAISLATLVEFGLNQWLPSYYVRQFGLPVDEVGLRYGLAVALGGIPGSLIGGALAAALMHRDVRWLGWLPALMYGVAVPTGLIMLQAQEFSRALALKRPVCVRRLCHKWPGVGGILHGSAAADAYDSKCTDSARLRSHRPFSRAYAGGHNQRYGSHPW